MSTKKTKPVSKKVTKKTKKVTKKVTKKATKPCECECLAARCAREMIEESCEHADVNSWVFPDGSVLIAAIFTS